MEPDSRMKAVIMLRSSAESWRRGCGSGELLLVGVVIFD